MKKLLTLTVAAAAAALNVNAKTLALWPIDHDGTTFDGRNAVSSANPLALVSGSTTGGLGWALPSNPDVSGMVSSPLNGGTAIASGTSARYTMEATGSFGDRVTNTKEWTAEGWINISAKQTASWMIILQGGGGSGGGNGGWMLRWQGNEGARYFCLTVANDSSGKNGYDSKIGPQALSSTFENSFVGSWHHIALTHKLENGKSVWRLYIDGNNEIDGTAAVVEKLQSGSYSLGSYQNLYFGGRPNGDNRLNASFDYWRVSDKALEPSEFLCAEAATPGSGESRVAYLAPDGTTHSQWISTGVSLKGDARKTCTVEIWAHPLSGLNITQLFIQQFANGNGRMNFGREPTNGKLRIWMGGYPAQLDSNRAIPLDTWTHVAWVADGDTWRLYINGELDAESTGHADHLLDASSADGFVIGNTRSSSPNGQSNAYFAEARVWKCARTGEEIKAAMGKRIENAWNIPNLIGYWPLNDGPADYALNGNKARNYAVLNPTAYTPSGAANFNYSYASGNRVGWVASALPVMGELQSEHSAVYGTGIHTNAVNTGINATPDAFTFMGWYLVNKSDSGTHNFLCGKSMNANGRMQFEECNGALGFWMGGGYNGKTSEVFTVAKCMPVGEWAHVALTKNGGTVKIYVNGKMVGENNAFTMGLCGANLHVGGFDAGGSRGGFNGAFRNVGFWSKAMSGNMIEKLMYALPKLDDAKLLGYWPLDEGEGNAVRNLKDGGADAVPVGSGFFMWNKGVNMMPPITDTVQPSGMMIIVR